MKVLAVDTTLGACSAAVVSRDAVLAQRFERMERGHAEALAPMVEQVMAESGIAFAALERLAVTIGPGSFTGQRVGLAFMRGLRLALKRPLVGVTSLAAMAYEAMLEVGTASAAAIHHAREDDVYFELMDQTKQPSGATLLPMLDAVTQVKQQASRGPIALAGNAQKRVAEALPSAQMQVSGVETPDAIWVARMAIALTPPLEPPRPLYLHAPAAHLPGRKK